MNKLLVVLSFFSLNCVFSQDTLYFVPKDTRVEDVSNIYRVVVISSNADEVSRLNSWLGFAVSHGRVYFGGTSFYIPKKHLFRLNYGFGLAYDGVMPFVNWENDYLLSVPIDANGVLTYIGKVPAVERMSLGIHYGFADSHMLLPSSEPERARELNLGLTLIKARYGNLLVSSFFKRRRGSRVMTFNLDAVRFFHYPEASWSGIVENERQFGFRLNLEGRASAWNRTGVFGFKWMIGLGTPAYRGIVGGWFHAGAGFSFSFL